MQTHMMMKASACNKKMPAISGNPHSPMVYLDSDESSSRYAVRDILRSGFDDYVKEHPVSSHKEKIVRAIMACGTGELGYSLSVCQDCGAIQMYADKCGCRYCPGCGYLRQLRWIEERKTEIIEGIPYFHVIFTVPHELNSLIFQNQKLLLNNLFRSVNQAILSLCAERRKMIPGIMMVLHTFGSALDLHYHIHMLVSGGGLSLDKKQFVHPASDSFFLPVQVISRRYRSLFLEGLKDLYETGQLEFFNDAQKYRNLYEWKELLDICYQKDWNVEIRNYSSPSSPKSGQSDPAETFSRYANRTAIDESRILIPERNSRGPLPEVDTAIEYLSRYSNRSAITDNRIQSWDSSGVTFEYKDYRNGGRKKLMTLSVQEFIRRFLLHILPVGLSKIRYGGFLAGCVKKKYLALIRELLGQEEPADEISKMPSHELLKHFYGIDKTICRFCNGRLLSVVHRVSFKNVERTIRSFSARAS